MLFNTSFFLQFSFIHKTSLDSLVAVGTAVVPCAKRNDSVRLVSSGRLLLFRYRSNFLVSFQRILNKIKIQSLFESN